MLVCVVNMNFFNLFYIITSTFRVIQTMNMVSTNPVSLVPRLLFSYILLPQYKSKKQSDHKTNPSSLSSTNSLYCPRCSTIETFRYKDTYFKQKALVSFLHLTTPRS